MVNSNIEQLLEGPLDPTWPLFMHVAPIIERFIETKGRVVLNIDDIFSEGTRAQRNARREEAEERVAQALMSYLDAAVPHMHVASSFFARQQRPAPRPQPYDVHEYKTDGSYLAGYGAHLQKVLDTGSRFDPDTATVLSAVAEYDQKQSQIRLDKPIHLGFRHGAHRIDDSPQFPVAFTFFRIKDPYRMGLKFARYICEGLQEHAALTSVLSESPQRKLSSLPSKVSEAFGGMHYYGLPTPFDLPTSPFSPPNPLEYLFVRSRVSDMVGVFNVTRSREDALGLLGKLVNRQHSFGDHYSVLFGKKLVSVSPGVWEYDNSFIIEDRFFTGSREKTGGNKNAATYVLPTLQNSRFQVRVDLMVSDLHGHGYDLPPNPGSHVIYEARQQKKIDGWERKYRDLYIALCHATNRVMERIDVIKYPLTSETSLAAK
ncbi:hypothetical protein HZA99_03850 [Candidatus Woesearchaeota archaeon]|nr:hypothetical protein [Candidatus Woesearchaeota archaeon]